MHNEPNYNRRDTLYHDLQSWGYEPDWSRNTLASLLAYTSIRLVMTKHKCTNSIYWKRRGMPPKLIWQCIKGRWLIINAKVKNQTLCLRELVLKRVFPSSKLIVSGRSELGRIVPHCQGIVAWYLPDWRHGRKVGAASVEHRTLEKVLPISVSFILN